MSAEHANIAAHRSSRYCVVGNPVAHSRSPWIHARFAELTGQTLQYDRMELALDGFAAGVRAFATAGGSGCNVTVPFKFEAFALADLLTTRAEQAGAVNTFRFEPDGRILGDNTDGAGLVADIERNAGVTLAGKRVLLLGAGGAAAGVIAPLLSARPARMVVCNRTADKAAALVARHVTAASLSNSELIALSHESLEGNFDIIFNATASSLAGAALKLPDHLLAPGALAVDLMYGPAAAGFLGWASQRGAVTRDGLGMLVEQAAESFELWRGVRPPSQTVLAELRALVV
jgi:shikimate dehydrogenase